LYQLIDTAPDLTSCIEGFNRLLLNMHDPKNARLSEYFFNQQGILRMYEDDHRAKQFEINKALSWAVQRQITEYANKILSLKVSEQDLFIVHDQLYRAWSYISAAGLAENDDQALVYAYIADGIFQALQGSEFHSELFNLPYLFDYDPQSHEYAVNSQQFQKIARILSLHEAQKNGILFYNNGGDFPELPENNNGGPNPPPPPPPSQDPTNNNDKDPENNIILPAVIAKELCEHHEVIDEADLALVQWFNKLDVAIKNNIRLADNFFTHIRYGSWCDKTQSLTGAHTLDAQCCLRFEHIRTLFGGHGERYGKWIYQGVTKQSSIFIDFNSRRFIEHLVQILESGKFELLPKKGTQVIINYFSDCGVEYWLQADNGKVFNTAFPAAKFIFSATADSLPKCVQNCIS
jgi:hypothetical protein